MTTVLSGSLIINNKKILLLFRRSHQHFETPGGKVNPDECFDIENPTINELQKTAERELYEEIGKGVKIKHIEYFSKTKFTIPDGRKAVANKFLVKISGRPKVNEPEVFESIRWIPIKDLDKYPLSPDLKILLPKIKLRFK